MAKTSTQRAEQPAPAEEKKLPVQAAANLPATSDGFDASELDVGHTAVSDRAEDRGTPLLYLAQKMSPAIDPKRSEYIEGLKEGMAFVNVTGRHFDAEKEGVAFIPCYHKSVWNEFVPREQGGGYQGSHPRDVDLDQLEATPHPKDVDKRRGGQPIRMLLPSGNEIIFTHQYYGFLADTMQPIIVPMASTNLGASSALQTLLNEQRRTLQWVRENLPGLSEEDEVRLANLRVLPSYFNVYLLKSVYTTNDQGSWYKWRPSLLRRTEPKAVRDMCAEFAKACERGDVEVARPMSEAEASAGDDSRSPI